MPAPISLARLCGARPADRGGGRRHRQHAWHPRGADAGADPERRVRPTTPGARDTLGLPGAAVMLAVYRALLRALVTRGWERLIDPVHIPAWRKAALLLRHGITGR